MRKWALIVVAVASVLGTIIAGISTSQHLRIEREGFEKPSFCAISEKINCDIVNASSYSEFLGIPVAAWGFIYYCLVGLMALAGVFARKGFRSTISAAWFLSLAGILYSAYLAYVAVAVLGVVCIECLAMYFINIVLVVFLFAALKISLGGIVRFIGDYMKAIFGRPSNLGFSPRAAIHFIVIALVFLVGWGIAKGVVAKETKGRDMATTDEKVRAFNMQSLHSIEDDPAWAVWGNPSAKVTIVEYSDFECPICRLAAFKIKPRIQEFKDKVRYYFVNYPLDQACNKDIEHPMHKYACFAAKAAMCANKKGDFWGFHDDLFRNQRGMNDEKIIALAQKRGWDRDEFLSCIGSPEVEEQIQKDIQSGKRIHVEGTPSVFLNNRKLRYWQDSDFLQTIVKQEIKKLETRN